MTFNRSSISAYLTDYASTLGDALHALDLEPALRACRFARRIFVGGNGGSASIADHLQCDFAKGARLNVHSLVGNLALTTALANDLGYEHVLEWQLEHARAGSQDALILISSSGNSPNIVRAARFANAHKIPLIGLSGFEGGVLASLANYRLHIPVANYGVVEDAHQAIMHVLAQFISATPR